MQVHFYKQANLWKLNYYWPSLLLRCSSVRFVHVLEYCISGKGFCRGACYTEYGRNTMCCVFEWLQGGRKKIVNKICRGKLKLDNKCKTIKDNWLWIKFWKNSVHFISVQRYEFFMLLCYFYSKNALSLHF